jgi:hypothetical protein
MQNMATMTQEDAAGYLAVQVYSPQFFGKLASCGVEPANEAEAQQLLELAGVLKTRGYRPHKVAQAASGNPFLAHCLAKEARQRPVDPAAIKQACLQAIQNDPQLLAATQVIDSVLSAAA